MSSFPILTGENGVITLAYPVGDVRRYGAKGDGVTDDSTAIQNALNGAALRGSSTVSKGGTAYFPPGFYLCNTITWPHHVNILGEETRIVTLAYNGPGGANSTVLNCVGQSFARLEHVSLIGFAPGSFNVSENLIRFSTGTLDLNFTINDTQFLRCLGNAIHQVAGQWVNLHLTRVRFDGIGGYGMLLRTFPGHESRPFSIRNWTLDNNNSALPAPHNAATRWGNGLLRVVNGGHNTNVGTFEFKNGRVEKNLKYSDTTQFNYTAGEPLASVYFDGNAPAGAGQFTVDVSNVTITGSENIEAEEAFITADGFTTSDAVKGAFSNVVLAKTENTSVYKSNRGPAYNIPASITSLHVKSKAERSFVRARLNSDQTAVTAGGAPKIVKFDSQQIDSLEEFDVVANRGRFTPTSNGWYRVNAAVKFDAGVAASRLIAYIVLNGTALVGTDDIFPGTSAKTIKIDDIVQLNGTTDYIEIGVFHTTGSDRTLKAVDTFISIERVLF